MKPGFRGGGIQRGQGLPWHTILLARSSVLHLGRWAGAKGACEWAAQDAFDHAGQAGFAGGTAGKDEACETLKPPGQQRMCGLGGSGATGKPTQPRRPRCIKPSSPVLRCSRFSFLDIAPKNGFAFFRDSLHPVFHNSVRREKQKTRYFSKATIAVFGRLGFSGSRKKRIARFAKRCVFVVSHSARLRISASPVSQLKRNSPHSPSQSA